MLPSAIVEQQAKLGVSAEESKAERLKRQQARFRDRGGIFIPSESNPLVDILLARTVSGESPSKARPKDVAAKRLSSSKARRASATHKANATTLAEGSQTVAGSSKAKLPTSRKRKAKPVEPEVDTATKPAPKRRGRPPKAKKKAPDTDPHKEQSPLPNTKSTSKAKGKQRKPAVTSTSDGKPKPKAKPKAKSNTAKEVVEVLVSDDDQTLVEAPPKTKSKPKRNIRYEDDGETDDDTPIVRKRAIPHADDSKASGTKTTTRVKADGIIATGSSRKKILVDGEERVQDKKHPKPNAKKRLVPHDDDNDIDVASPPAKKGKVAHPTSAKSKIAIEPEPTPHTTKDVKSGERPKATGKGKGKAGAEPDRDIVERVGEGVDEPPPERVSKPKKRKKEEDNYDDRPRKTVKFSESGPPHSSSQKLKENQSDRKHDSVVKSSVKDEPDALRPKLATKPPSRTMASKGPPREVLERIKASAARHLRCADSEPDELDCLS